MSLYQRSSGLLDTHVQWPAVEAQIRAGFKTSASLGPGKKIEKYGVGNGFLSTIGLVTCDWQGKRPGEKLPDKVILKIGSCIEAKALDDAKVLPLPPANNVSPEERWKLSQMAIMQNHNVECAIYDFYRPFADDLLIPKAYATVRFGPEAPLSGFMALEFIDKSIVQQVYEVFTYEQMTQVAREIGKMQALGHIEGIAKSRVLTDNRDVYKGFYSTFSVESFKGMIGSLTKYSPCPQFAKNVAEVVAITDQYHGSNLPVTYHTQTSMNPVIVHGDMWCANILFEAGDTRKLKAIIDWQLAHMGCGGEDIYRLAMMALSAKERRRYIGQLLEHVYDSMSKTLQTVPAPYTKTQFMESTNFLAVHFAFFLLPTLILSLAFYTGDPSISADEKSKRTAVIIDKIGGILEDILTWNKAYKLIAPKFKWRMMVGF